MTRIAIFCDGTWNSPDIPEPTSVHKLAQALVNDPAKGQVVAYFKGIGTDRRFDGPMMKMLNKYAGGAFGWGLDAKVKQAYQFLAQAYHSGDEIYLFGFSRGAYTARSVAGMIRKCGIVQDTSTDGINKAFQLYRKRGKRNHPDAPHIRAARREMSPKFGTSVSDLAWRNDTSRMVAIPYLGVWDTVGARGIPPSLLGPVATVWNLQYAFHDMALSSLVQSARHALALDELRVLYKPAKWDNLDGDKGLNNGDTGPLRPYQQMWFVGNHGIVGGSGSSKELSAITLDWVVQGAGRLTIDPQTKFPPTTPDPLVDVQMDTSLSWLRKWRQGPMSDLELHPSVTARKTGRPDYRPGSLRL
ncbi:DUF2235 domain-containing protein [Tateyamaria omphalii]|uniref:DUF2235 domain-containing protein n=1 Tax=Tateyamaria omphalii TaxID=299262 RepID=UPI001C997007|nr:DUF2235 domain-containing protein [Tateyamaria omphalii]MBY5934014.1 DUF2235 domain-containing protein [Tateyamaria omphalii]